jgi:O-antigen ligase
MFIDPTVLLLLIPVGIIALIYLFKYPEIAFGLFIFAYIIKGGINLGFLNLTAIMLIIAASGFFLPVITGRRVSLKPKMSDFWLLGFVIILLIGYYLTPNPEGGFIKIARFITIVLIPYVLARVFLRDWEKIKRFLITIFIVASIYSILLTFLSFLGGYGGGRIEFLEVNVIPLATLLAVGLIIAVIGTVDHLFTKWKIRRAYCVIMIPLFIYTIFLTGTRGPLFSTIIGLGFYFLLIFKKRPKLVAVIAFVCILMIIFLMQNSNLIYSYLSEKIPNLGLYLIGEIKSGQSTLQRKELYSLAIAAFFRKPLLGIGTEGFAEISPLFVYPHNIFLEIGAENGIIGLILFICFLFTIGWYGLRYLILYFSKLNNQTKTITLTILTISLTLLIEKQFSYGLDSHKDLFVFLALIANLSQISKNSYFSK